jgi:NADH:ubiquinone oxidoreductase subunit 6 (subunit J)
MDQNSIIITNVLFWILAPLTGLCALMVVLTQNVVRMAAWLLFTLAGTAGVFFLLGADFIGATQLLVYVGGTLVLVVFGVMLTAQGPFITMKTGAGEWALAAVVGGLLYGVIGFAVGTAEAWKYVENPLTQQDPATSTQTEKLGIVLLGVKEGAPDKNITGLPPSATPINRTRVSYLLPFEIVSVHLLVVLIGAAYLARAKRRKSVGGLPS